MSLEDDIRSLYEQYGQQKPIGISAANTHQPHYFLIRTFLGENDLLIILNTKRCRFQCHFCQLPAKSSRTWISGEDILAQFGFVANEVRHALSILDRVTLSNEGSVLDTQTIPTATLLTIARCVQELRRVHRLVLETRLEFVETAVIQQIKQTAPRCVIDILTGFETLNLHIRDEVLHKSESLDMFRSGLDRVSETKSELTSYVLYKPDPSMTDNDAFVEANETIDYLVEQCQSRGIPLTIRLNPMYLAKGSKWAELAHSIPQYQPPRLTDIMRLAERKRKQGVRVYIGLSTEGLNEPEGTYMSRDDYTPRLIKPIKLFNDCKIACFEWDKIQLGQ